MKNETPLLTVPSRSSVRKHAFYGILALVSLLTLGITQSARANFIATINQVGTDVVVTGSGTFDLTGIGSSGNGTLNAAVMTPSGGILNLATGPVSIYSSGLSGPTSFGGGFNSFANSSSGDAIGINGGFATLFLPQGYLTGGTLSATSTYNNKTFASLGLTPGIYTWTWGTGMHADSFTLQIGAVPDAGSTLSLLGFASLGLVALRRKLRC